MEPGYFSEGLFREVNQTKTVGDFEPVRISRCSRSATSVYSGRGPSFERGVGQVFGGDAKADKVPAFAFEFFGASPVIGEQHQDLDLAGDGGIGAGRIEPCLQFLLGLRPFPLELFVPGLARLLGRVWRSLATSRRSSGV
jgi:hypothetical protein